MTDYKKLAEEIAEKYFGLINPISVKFLKNDIELALERVQNQIVVWPDVHLIPFVAASHVRSNAGKDHTNKECFEAGAKWLRDNVTINPAINSTINSTINSAPKDLVSSHVEYRSMERTRSELKEQLSLDDQLKALNKEDLQRVKASWDPKLPEDDC